MVKTGGQLVVPLVDDMEIGSFWAKMCMLYVVDVLNVKVIGLVSKVQTLVESS